MQTQLLEEEFPAVRAEQKLNEKRENKIERYFMNSTISAFGKR